MRSSHTIYDTSHPEELLTAFSQCHAGIVSQFQSFAELPALQVAAAQARHVARNTLALLKDAVYAHHADEENVLFRSVVHWTAAGFLEAENSFRKLRGHAQMRTLINALRPDTQQLKKAASSS